MNKSMKEAIKFFAANAGYAEPPGRLACAKSLAEAEVKAQEYGLQVNWEDDYDSDTSWMDAEQLKDFEAGDLVPFCLRIFNADNSEVLAALGGIFLYVHKDNDDTKRVYEAECFQEAVAAIMTGKAKHCAECSA